MNQPDNTASQWTVSLAEPHRLDAVVALYDAVVRDLDQRGIFQWTPAYPNRKYIKASLDARDLFVVEPAGAPPALAAAAVLCTVATRKFFPSFLSSASGTRIRRSQSP